MKRNVIIFWCIFFILFGGLRWKIGTDWESYYDVFKEATFGNIFSYDRYGDGRDMLEPGYVFLNALIKQLLGQYHFFNIFATAVFQLSCYKASRFFTPKTPIMTYAFLVVFGGFFPIRATLGLAVAFWGYKYIKEQNFLKFILILALTCSIHMKFLIFLPCYWAGRIKLHWFIYLGIYVSIVAFYLVFQQQIALLATLLDSSSGVGAKLTIYTTGETEGFKGISYLGVGLNLFLMSIYLYLRSLKIINNEIWMNAMLNLYLASCCIYALFSDGMGDLARLATLFILPQTLLLIYAVDYFSHSRIPALKIGSVSFFSLYFIYRAFQATHGYFFEDTCVPYKTIFDYNISFL